VLNVKNCKLIKSIIVVGLLTIIACQQENQQVPSVTVSVTAPGSYEQIVVELEKMIRTEMTLKGLPSLSIS
ncbi:uncharacterized protein METZ01_LOCUS306660, partial [marine metagenome]